MAGRECSAMERAVARALAGETISGAARAESVTRQALRRALDRRGVPMRTHVAGADHHAYIDGRSARRHADV
jgi:hypothetical protein